MMYSFISLVGSFLTSAWLEFWFWPLVKVAFIATVPRMIHALLER